MEECYLLPIRNYFHDLSFVGCSRNISGGTLSEILHVILLVLCEYISEGLKITFTNSTIDIISHVVVGIYEDSHQQSERCS